MLKLPREKSLALTGEDALLCLREASLSSFCWMARSPELCFVCTLVVSVGWRMICYITTIATLELTQNQKLGYSRSFSGGAAGLCKG